MWWDALELETKARNSKALASFATLNLQKKSFWMETLFDNIMFLGDELNWNLSYSEVFFGFC